MFALNSHYYYFYYSAVKIAAAARKQAVASEAKGALYRHSCNRAPVGLLRWFIDYHLGPYNQYGCNSRRDDSALSLHHHIPLPPYPTPPGSATPSPSRRIRMLSA